MIRRMHKDAENDYAVTELCEAFGLSRAGYYAARKAPCGPRALEEASIQLGATGPLKTSSCPNPFPTRLWRPHHSTEVRR